MSARYDDVINNIKLIIEQKGMKQVAERAGFTQPEFSNIMRGRKLLRVEHLAKVSNALGVEINDLYQTAVK